jgi:DNA invertase Pin-like site-specific DNA recombinase
MVSKYDVVGIWKEVGSGVKTDRAERKNIMALAQDRRIEAIVVTELTRWGRSTIDLIQTLQQLQAWGVSLRAQTGLDFDLSTPQGKMMASVMAALAEFERDLLSERIRSGLAAAKAKGKHIGRRAGQRIKADRLSPKVLALKEEGFSYRQIAWKLDISKNTVTDIVKRHRQTEPQEQATL